MQQGSVEQAVAGEYDLSIEEVLADAWRTLQGFKSVFIAAFILYTAAGYAARMLIGSVLQLPHYEEGVNDFAFVVGQVGLDFLAMPVEIPMFAALFMMGIRRVNGGGARVGDLFRYYLLVWPLVFASIALYLLITAGFFLLLFPGIYLALSYLFVYPLIIDKKLGIWEAMEVSRKAVTHRWFTLFAIVLLVSVVTGLSALPLWIAMVRPPGINPFLLLPLGIGLIWSLPMCYLVYGAMYSRIFGFSDGPEQEYFPETEGD